jgi:hypothetical protein
MRYILMFLLSPVLWLFNWLTETDEKETESKVSQPTQIPLAVKRQLEIDCHHWDSLQQPTDEEIEEWNAQAVREATCLYEHRLYHECEHCGFNAQ